MNSKDIERQEVRELEQMDLGIRRYYKEVDAQGAGDVTSGKGMVLVAMKAMIPVIEEQQRKLESGDTHPSQVPGAWHHMLGLRADAMAYITARVGITAAAAGNKLTRTAMQIANLINEDYGYEELEQAQPALANSMSRKAAKWSTSGARRRIMRLATKVGGVKIMGWTEAEKVRLGVALIEALVTTTGLVEVKKRRTKGKTTVTLALTDAATDRLRDNNLRLEAERPVNLPMLVPPRAWINPTTGGYLTERLRKNLVRGVRNETRDDIFSVEMPEVYAAVNKVQATKWRINTAVYDLMQGRWDAQDWREIGGMPTAEDEPLPERPDIIDRKLHPDKMPPDMHAAFIEWKQRAAEIHGLNAKMRSRRVSLLTKLSIAADLRDVEQFYFPHSLDFRGRVYSMTSELSPQADDYGKALLEFAEGKPLGETGGYWLAVHIANLFGEDKMSFDDRVTWVVNNTDALMDSAMNPLDGQQFWMDADDPWSALAACFEWTGFQIEGPDYVSHLPIAMDGSCSGIQHFSAMLRDAEGGRAVNLRHTEVPSDIYTEVLTVTKGLLAENQEPLAKVWMDKIDRKIVKRPCMTFAYSVTSIGIRDQIASEMRKKTNGQYLSGHENWQAAAFLAPIVEEAIRDVVKRAAEAMDWLKLIAKQHTDNALPTTWMTPLGFPVVQPYRRAKGKKFEVMFAGIRTHVTLTIESHNIDGRKQQLSVAPNFVHSLDATHLMMVVNRLAGEEVTRSYAMIHDSFGVHACDVDELHFIIRDEFIKLYSEDILTETYRSTLLALPGEKWPDVPTPPEPGDLNLEEVRDADFFFA